MRPEKTFKPIPFNPVKFAEKKRRESPAFRKEYDALEDEFATLGALLRARKEAELTQAQVAERMGISQPTLARIESSLASRRHSPTLATLRKYAKACGKRLVIRMMPAHSEEKFGLIVKETMQKYGKTLKRLSD